MSNGKNNEGVQPQADITAGVNSMEQLRAIMENMNSGVAVVAYGEAGEVRSTYANDQYYRLFGYTRAQLASEVKRPHDTVVPEDAQYCISMIDSVKKTREPVSFKYRAVRRDGKRIVVRCSASIAAINGLSDSVLISIITDITASVDAERQALVAGQRLAAIVSHISSGVAASLLHDDGSVDYVFVSDKYYELLGYTREQYRREVSDPFSLIHKDDVEEVRKAAAELCVSGGSEMLKYRVMRRDGRVIWLKVDISMMSFADVDVPVQLSVFEDITAPTEYEEQLRSQEARMTKLMNEMPGGIAVVEVDRRDVRGTLKTTYYNDSFFS